MFGVHEKFYQNLILLKISDFKRREGQGWGKEVEKKSYFVCALRKFIIRHYHQLKAFTLGVSVKFYSNPIKSNPGEVW